ncbi:MAG: preprotein translocase subunit SecE [Desulfobacterales bacterium]|nr:preprotein translocase subunit SecE [Desulfobacterales bacterium]
MGRILKKKDPEKKKAQRLEKNGDASSTPQSGEDGAAAAPKKAPVIAKSKAPVPVGEKNFLDKSLQFLREVKIELKKVTWHSRKQTMGSTLVVIILVMIISLFLGVIDFSLGKLMQVVLP